MIYFISMKNIIIFSDGASRGNPGKGGWGAIIKKEDNITEIGGAEDETTNNRMEMRALLEALRTISNEENIIVYTDSSYLINGMTKWVVGWKNNNWQTKQKTEVLNRDLWEELSRLSEGKKITWNHLPGHSGVPGNERADVIATKMADGDDADLYNGSPEEYKIDLDNVKADSVSKDKKNRAKMKAYSYLSLVDTKVKRHDTWAECEERVKGKSNVKFRKAISLEDENDILKDWGVSLG